MPRHARDNPFSPGSDHVPRVWAGRVEQLSDFTDRLAPRRLAGMGERGRTLLGEPGIGKSSLARRIAADARERGHLTSRQLRLPRGVDPIPLLAEELLQLAHDAGLTTRREHQVSQLLRRVEALTLGPIGVHLAAGNGLPPHRLLTLLLEEVSRSGRQDGRLTLLQLDEVQNIEDGDQLSQLLIAVGDALGSVEEVTDPSGTSHEVALPLVVYLTGLPEFIDLASARNGATFARRFQLNLLDPLSDDDLTAALAPFIAGWEIADGQGGILRVTMTRDAIGRLVSRSLGDPFLFQLIGQAAWDADPASSAITATDVERGWRQVTREARSHVERQLDRLPDKERQLLEAMANIDPSGRTATAIARELGYSSATQIGTAAQRLDSIRGLIVRGKPYHFRVRTVEAYLTGRFG
jgi:hypothetical protein